MIDFGISLQSRNVLLRPMIREDLYSFSKIAGDEDLWTWFSKDLSKDEELRSWVDEALNALKQQTRLPFTIIEKSSGEPIGSTSFGNISMYDKRIEIGWTWIAKAFHGTGVNSQIKYLMMRYAFEELKFERVEIKTDVLNIRARKALLKTGATEEGILRSHMLMINGRRRDTIYYSVLSSEWDRVKPLVSDKII
jgi:RimJ/RimL family protein N-acetyltransferase